MYPLKTLVFRDSEILYDGVQLAPHWLYQRFDLSDNAVVGFLGGADVSLAHMVDLEDVKRKAPIFSPKMLHFVGEWFIDSLEIGILLQHLFVAQVYECLLERGIQPLTRTGNDLYFQGRKLSVSIATKSSLSVLIHFGINIFTEGTPIPTSGLAEMNVDPLTFAEEILERFSRDMAIWRKARVKVLPR